MCTPAHWKLGGRLWLGTVAPPHTHFLRGFFTLSEKMHQLPRSTFLNKDKHTQNIFHRWVESPFPGRRQGGCLLYTYDAADD